MRRWFWLVALFILLAIFALFFPQFASTGVGKRIVIGIAEKKTGAKIQMSAMHLTWFGPQSFEGVQFKSADVDGSWNNLTARMPLWNLRKLEGEFNLTDGNFSFHSESLGQAEVQNVNATILGQQFSATGTTHQGNAAGSFSIKGFAAKFPSDYSLEGNLTTIPTIILDNLLRADGLIVEALGNTFTLQGSAQAQSKAGSLDLTLSSPNWQTEIHGDFDGKSLKLRQPMDISFTLTPVLSAALLKDVNPLFLTGVQSKNPIRLSLSPKDFSFPYAKFDWKDLSIGHGRLDMGQVRIQNGPTLQSVIALLQSNWLRDTREMNAWFTPLDFSIRNGVVDTDRLDLLLADSIHLCTWGRIFLSTDKLDMYLGLPADTLEHSFGIKGLNSDYVLKVPIRGTTRKPEINSGAATAQIATLVAAQNIPLPKIGKAFGSVLTTVTQLKNDKDVPPAKHPFPWER